MPAVEPFKAYCFVVSWTDPLDGMTAFQMFSASRQYL
jgi:hypothetical protein